MDIALLTELNVDQILEAINTDHWSNAAETPGNLSIRQPLTTFMLMEA